MAIFGDWANAGGADSLFSTELEITTKSEYRRNRNLNRSNIGFSEPEIAGTLSYNLNRQSSMTIGMTLGGEYFFIDQANEETDLTKLEFDKLLFAYKGFDPKGLTFEIGRQKLRDRPREWLVSKTLDGARLVYATATYSYDVSATRERLVRINLLSDDAKPPINNYTAFANFAVFPDIWIGGYAMHRDDRTSVNKDLTFLGTRSRGKLAGQLEFWLDTGFVTGSNVAGHAVDMGLMKMIDAPFSPVITFGYAWGSGDDNPNDGKDDAYRQTGLHVNEGKFGGLSKFKYYGQVVEPDLSNIHIFTLGLGIRPIKDVSLDLIYHHYRLSEYADKFSARGIEGDLTRQSKDLGHELDVVLGMRRMAGLPWLECTLIGGYFWPGKGFSHETRDPAAFVSLEFIAKFETGAN